jgi:hypothetical protein
VVPARDRQRQGVRLACRFTYSDATTLAAGVAMAAALAATALPVIRLARMQPASLIRIFANER